VQDTDALRFYVFSFFFEDFLCHTVINRIITLLIINPNNDGMFQFCHRCSFFLGIFKLDLDLVERGRCCYR
jgi:hypothetical protein